MSSTELAVRSKPLNNGKKKSKPKPRDVEETSLVESSQKTSVDEILKNALNSSTDDHVKPRRKKKVAEQMLENLRKGEGLQKEADDLVEANTFDPDNDKGSKSNRRRQKERETQKETGKDNKAFVEDLNEDRTKKKKPKRNTRGRTIEEEHEEEELQEIPLKETTFTLENENQNRKKKKKSRDPVEEYERELAKAQEGVNSEPATARESESQILSEEEKADKTPGHHKKKKVKTKKKKSKTQIEEEEPEEARDDGTILGVNIHRTDKLRTDFWMAHPLVRVSVVDAVTGCYVRKREKSRPVASYFETENEKLDFVLPIMTQPYDFKRNRSTLPMWDETLVWNESFKYFIQESPDVLLLFEVLDFVTMRSASNKYAVEKEDGGWHKVAWAFLKLRSTSGELNVNRKLRLQLFQPVRFHYMSKPNQPEVFQWWSHNWRNPYQSTLYVTVKGLQPSQEVQPSTRSMFPIQREQSSHHVVVPGHEDDEGRTPLSSHRDHPDNRLGGEPTLWARLGGQGCKVPNCLMLTLTAGKHGCSMVKFSHSGKFLACACEEKDGHSILIYEIPSGKPLGHMAGHLGIIYDLSWSRGDGHLASASSDGTVKTWNMRTLKPSPERVAPHPTFVYAAVFHPRTSQLLVTGGYDHVIRIWLLQKSTDKAAELVQELEGHTAFVNSLCFDDDGELMYSGDADGKINMWNAHIQLNEHASGLERPWTHHRSLDLPDSKGVCIDHLEIHPNNRRLLVQTRDNTLRMIDLRVMSIMQRYMGALNFRERISSSISPCGGFVFAGSEDSCVYVWNCETGDQVAVYAELGYQTPVCSVHYHPHDHMVVFCALGECSPVIIYNFDDKVARLDAGFKDTSTSLDTRRRARSPTLKGNLTDNEGDFELEESSRYVISAREDAHSADLTRKERILRKLQTVSPVVPSAFSPHADNTLGNISARQQFASQAEYLRKSSSGYRPLFSSIGKSGSLHSRNPSLSAHPTHLSMNMTSSGAEFTVSGRAVPQEIVVALYDYSAQRSDELALMQGDQIKVLFKDNDNWWMGEDADGKQGFFPANYVTNMDSSEADMLTLPEYPVSSRPPTGASVHKPRPTNGSSSHMGGSRERRHSSQDRTFTAVRTKSGELKIIGAGDDSDNESTPRRRASKGKKPADLTVEDEIMAEVHKTSHKSRRRSRQMDTDGGDSIA